MRQATRSIRGYISLPVTGILIIFTVHLFQGYGNAASMVTYSVRGYQGEALLCRPEGKGPSAIVVYNHAVIVDNVGYRKARARGYNMDKICEALAAEGFLVFAPIRRSGPGNLVGLKEQVSQAVDYVKSLPDVDPSRIVLMGFSRGGTLTLMVAVERKDLKAIIIQAPAPAGGYLVRAIKQIAAINAPVLLMVEAADTEINLSDVEELEKALRAHAKDVRSIRYTRGGGHQLFWDVGYYWDDVKNFLRERLGPP